MHFYLLALAWVYTSLVSATIIWRLQKSANPTADQADAYTRIEAAMNLAAKRYNRLSVRPTKSITVQYATSVSTAEGSFSGVLRFGSKRAYMNERTALHEIS